MKASTRGLGRKAGITVTGLALVAAAGCGGRSTDFKDAYLYGTNVVPGAESNDSYLLLTVDGKDLPSGVFCTWISRNDRKPRATLTGTLIEKPEDLWQGGGPTQKQTPPEASCTPIVLAKLPWYFTATVDYGLGATHKTTAQIDASGASTGERVGFIGPGATYRADACKALAAAGGEQITRTSAFKTTCATTR